MGSYFLGQGFHFRVEQDSGCQISLGFVLYSGLLEFSDSKFRRTLPAEADVGMIARIPAMLASLTKPTDLCKPRNPSNLTLAPVSR